MQKIPFDEPRNNQDDLLPEYHFNYQKAKPNRLASQSLKQGRMVVLDNDVAQVFTTPGSVDKALRALIEAIPQTPKGDTAS